MYIYGKKDKQCALPSCHGATGGLVITDFKQFRVVQNYFAVVEKLTKINHRKNAKTIFSISVHSILLLHITS